MIEEIGPAVAPAVVGRQLRPQPSQGLIISTVIAGIATIICSASTLIFHFTGSSVDATIRNAIWWVSWGVLVVDVILTFISTSKKYRPTKQVAIAGILGLAGAIMLLIAAFLQ